MLLFTLAFSRTQLRTGHCLSKPQAHCESVSTTDLGSNQLKTSDSSFSLRLTVNPSNAFCPTWV